MKNSLYRDFPAPCPALPRPAPLWTPEYVHKINTLLADCAWDFLIIFLKYLFTEGSEEKLKRCKPCVYGNLKMIQKLSLKTVYFLVK